jgi:hypothetical protein
MLSKLKKTLKGTVSCEIEMGFGNADGWSKIRRLFSVHCYLVLDLNLFSSGLLQNSCPVACKWGNPLANMADVVDNPLTTLLQAVNLL